MTTANPVNTWDAKLLASILLRQHTVVGLPGTDALATRGTRTASAQNVLFLLEEPTMLKDRMAAALQVILTFGDPLNDALDRLGVADSRVRIKHAVAMRTR